MKHGKALRPHTYAGKRRNVGDVYPIRRADWKILELLGHVEIVEPEPVHEYFTTAVEYVKPKRQYTRKKKAEIE